MVGDSLLASSLVERLPGGRFQPSFEDLVAGQHERIRHPAEIGVLRKPVNARADIGGRDFGHRYPHMSRLYSLAC